MIFFKFNSNIFTITILAFFIVPAYSDENCFAFCEKIITLAGFKDNLDNDYQNSDYPGHLQNVSVDDKKILIKEFCTLGEISINEKKPGEIDISEIDIKKVYESIIRLAKSYFVWIGYTHVKKLPSPKQGYCEMLCNNGKTVANFKDLTYSIVTFNRDTSNPKAEK